MLDKLHGLIKNNFFRNVLTVAAGTAGAQAVALAVMPIVTRLYGPEAFGILGTFTSIVAVLGPVAALTYPVAIMLPKQDQDASGVARLSLILAALVAVASAFILLISKPLFVSLFNISNIDFFIVFLSLYIFLFTCLQVAEQWLIRNRLFLITAKASMARALIIAISNIGIGLFYPAATVLVALFTIGNGLQALFLWLGYKKRQPSKRSRINEENGQQPKLIELAGRYRDFPKFRAPQVLLNSVSQGLPVILLASFYGPAAAGFFALGKQVLGAPVTLIGKSVGDVFYPRFVQAANDGENLSALLMKSTLFLSFIGILPFGVIVAFGPWLFAFVFGDEWYVAGEYARWLALWFFFLFINPPVIKAIPVLEMQRFFLKYEFVALILKAASLACGFFVADQGVFSIALFSLCNVLLYVFLIVIVFNKARSSSIKLRSLASG